jgi:hypothetical protein
MKLILVCIGNFQSYILDNIQNLLLFGNNNIDIIIDYEFSHHFDNYKVNLINASTLNIPKFNSNLDKNFRNGFWYLCSLRLFYIYAYIKKYQFTNCFHIENDVMIYENLESITYKFNQNKIYSTFDSDKRVVPSIIFIPNYHLLQPIINNYNPDFDDMYNLGMHDILPLPIGLPSMISHKITDNFKHFDLIFDAAGIGQYLGGVDPRNTSGDTTGFINETCLIKYNNYSFYWIKINNNYQPFLYYNNQYYQIINLHIHSKNLSNFIANKPIQNKYIKILN